MHTNNIKEALGNALGSIEAYDEVLTLFFEALPDPIFVINEEGKLIKALGGNASDIYRSAQYLEGKYIKDVFSSYLAEKFHNAINEAISSNKLVLTEYEINSSNSNLLPQEDSSRWYEGRIHPIRQKGKDKRVVLWISIDKTLNKKMEQELLQLAITDPLTGAYNRRYFNDNLTRQISEFSRYKNVFSLLMLDVDHFKQLNDTFGHDLGDETLKGLVKTSSKLLRDIDIFARYGGEEFMILLPNTPSEEATVVANRLRVAVAQDYIDSGNTKIYYTVSIGVTEIKDQKDDIESITKRADIALYQAKERGRNQVCRFCE